MLMPGVIRRISARLDCAVNAPPVDATGIRYIKTPSRNRQVRLAVPDFAFACSRCSPVTSIDALQRFQISLSFPHGHNTPRYATLGRKTHCKSRRAVSIRSLAEDREQQMRIHCSLHTIATGISSPCTDDITSAVSPLYARVDH